MKAFLSHSSSDKEFVQAIARDLGRQFCVFDEATFDSAIELRESIKEGLGRSDLFVLFLSREALDSSWVAHEVDEAWYAKTHGELQGVLVYRLDAGIEIEELPEWLRRAKISTATSPQAATREIRGHLQRLLDDRQRPVFVGRTKEIVELETALTPLDSQPPRVFFVSGLPGVGRRSLLGRVIPSLLGLRRLIQVKIGEGDSIADISIQIAAEVETYNTTERFRAIVEEIEALEEPDALARLIGNLGSLIALGDLPVLVDDGGIIADDGRLTPAFTAIVTALPPREDIYVAAVAARRPQGLKDLAVKLPIVSVGPMGKQESARLIRALSESRGLDLSGAQVREIADDVAGYPPAAYFAVDQCERYGVDAVLADKSALNRFGTTVFLRHLGETTLDDIEILLLRILAVYSPLPFRAIRDLANLSPGDTADRLVRMMDMNFVVTNHHSEYLIAAPVADAVLRAFDWPDVDVSRRVATVLVEYTTDATSTDSVLALSRSLFRAALMSGEQELADQALHLANDLIRLTEELYHAKRYAEVVDMARAALVRRPDSTSARAYLIRALAYEERWAEADDELAEYRGNGQPKELAFLEGFVARRAGRFGDAIDRYQEAIRLGRGGASVQREVASCYFQLGDYDAAAHHIDEGLRRSQSNKFLLDLAVQVATIRGDVPRARTLLAELRGVESKMWYQHRLARVELLDGNTQAALSASECACGAVASPRFEVLAQLAHIQLVSGRLADAGSTIERLEKRYSNIRHDVRLGLRARLALRHRRYREAVGLTDGFRKGDKPVHKATRLRVLAALLEHVAVADDERAGAEAEVLALRAELADDKDIDLLPFD